MRISRGSHERGNQAASNQHPSRVYEVLINGSLLAAVGVDSAPVYALGWGILRRHFDAEGRSQKSSYHALRLVSRTLGGHRAATGEDTGGRGLPKPTRGYSILHVYPSRQDYGPSLLWDNRGRSN